MKRSKNQSPRFDKILYECHYNTILKAIDTMFFHDESKSKFWMICTNPLLGNMSPISMLKLGRYQKLLDFVYNKMNENMAPR